MHLEFADMTIGYWYRYNSSYETRGDAAKSLATSVFNLDHQLTLITKIMKQVDDLNEPFTFQNNEFDLVHSQRVFTGINKDRWPSYVHDCARYIFSWWFYLGLSNSY